jgi:putative chitinase
MPVSVTIAQVLQLAPNAQPGYRQAFANVQAVFDQTGISASALRVAHFMAQILHESAGLSIQYEGLNYSPQRLPTVWPSRFAPQGPLNPDDYAHNPQKLANEVYAGRMGNTGPNDGYNYRGRGLLQLTGRDSYAEATRIVRAADANAPDFVADPEAVIAADWCLELAARIWAARGCNAMADQDAIRNVTKAINGGLIGLADRTEWLKRAKFVWPMPAA